MTEKPLRLVRSAEAHDLLHALGGHPDVRAALGDTIAHDSVVVTGPTGALLRVWVRQRGDEPAEYYAHLNGGETDDLVGTHDGLGSVAGIIRLRVGCTR
ncbi:hypothetical protein [Actinocorallia sp. A-T 12471]|uniref:hypothetical protein n=1 Tax=Actinocorallia sp. A-T 12471 TaxID=3089813 RepID=UPI0029CBFF85|nr:hypothetical protein [Actinocorallia sp. A-T 12471]MDX6741509.1 hypothetical protein [Actinocorallia sp. A-T 12471]